MPTRRASLFSRLILPAAVLALAGMACQILNPTPVAWSLTSTPAPSQSTANTQAASSTPTLKITLNPLPKPVQPSPTPTIPSAEGPWLLYAEKFEPQIVIHSLAGAGDRKVRLPAALLTGTDLQAGVSPDGKWLALRTGAEEASGLALHLLDIRGGELQTLTSLLNPELEQSAAEGSQPALQAAAAVTDPAGLAWSPDGRFLAYIGAADGSSSELYVYDLQKEKIERLTRGSNQAAAPFWSPDGKWIINQEVHFNADGQKTIINVWASAPVPPTARRLYTPAYDSQGEVLIGWTSSGNLLICSRTAEGVFKNLREFPLSARWTEPIYTPPFASAAFDPASRQVLFVQNGLTGKASGLTLGVYSLPLRTDDVLSIQEGAWEKAFWYSQPGLFTVSGPLGALALKPGGAPLAVDGEQALIPSPDGQWLAGLGSAGMPGARLYQAGGTRLQEWLKGPVWQAAWLPDSSGLYLVGEQGLYEALFPTAVARLVAEGVSPGGAALAAPSQP